MTVAAEWHGRLVGLALFYRECGGLGRRLLPLGISLSDYHDVLVDPAHMQEAWAALVDEMLVGGDWDSWEWEDLPPDAVALALPVANRVHAEVGAHNACPVLVVEAAGLRECLTKQQRNALNLALNRAGRLGIVTIEAATDSTVASFLDNLIHLHGLRWQSRGETGLLADPLVRRFHHAAARALRQTDLLRLYNLRIGADLAAAYYGFHHRERAYYYVSGFDPAYAFESPGVIIIAHAIEQARREGAREFHFLRGREPYKYAWGAVDRWNQRRSMMRSSSVVPKAGPLLAAECTRRKRQTARARR
jgi:CelD/BcsL family acetyltransferase involved in cellulose biosynthesis